MHLYRNSVKPIDDRVNDLLSRMTYDEKIAQLSATIFGWGEQGFPARLEKDTLIKTPKYEESSRHGLGGIAYLHMSLFPKRGAEYANALQKDMVENTRLGIPLFIFDECMHCQFAQGTTMFPIPPAMAATFDPDLVRRVFDVIGRETRSRGGTMCFSPHLDLARDPRWGRMSETFGEDVHLVTRMAVAAVLGLQGGNVPGKEHIAATPKHYAGFGQSVGGRQMAPVDIPPRQFIDETLAPFKAVILEAGAAGVMPAYTEVDGIPCHGSHWLLTEVLRKWWGFTGVVASDFGGIANLAGTYHISKDIKSAATASLLAGVDMDLPGGTCYAKLGTAATISKAVARRIDESVKRVLALKMQLGLFDNPYVKPSRAAQLVNCADHQKIAIEVASKAITLLKNDNGLLPLSAGALKRIALIGSFANDKTGWRDKPDPRQSILGALEKKLGATVKVDYVVGCRLSDHDALGLPEVKGHVKGKRALEYPLSADKALIAGAVAAAAKADVAIICAGESGTVIGENFSDERATDRERLGLLGNQLELLKAVRKTGTPVVLVLIHGHSLVLREFDGYVDAILDCWVLGEGRGPAVVKTLFGEINPGGRLPVSCPGSVGQVPVCYSRRGGYFDRDYAFTTQEEKYVFGYGLSYTTFSYANMKLSSSKIKKGESVTMRVDVTNTGKRAGDEVVQAYLTDDVASVSRPRLQLKAFKRVTLKPGETRSVELVIPADAMRFTNEKMKQVIEPGTFTASVGPNSRELDLKGVFEVV